MALNVGQLAADFTKVFEAKPPTMAQAAQMMAAAYESYAQMATAVGPAVLLPMIPGAAGSMVPILMGGMSPAPIPGKMGLAWASAIPMFWLPAKFIGPPVPPSMAPTVSISIQFSPPGPLAAVLMIPIPGSPAAGAQLAAACHAYTISAQVSTNAGPFALL